MPERSKGSVSSTDVFGLVGSNPTVCNIFSLVKLNSEKMNGDLTKLSKKEICTISFRYFGCTYKKANPKPVLVAGLKELIAAQLTFLPAADLLPILCIF